MKRRKSRIILGTTAVAAALTFGGCAGSQNTAAGNSNTAATVQEKTEESATAETAAAAETAATSEAAAVTEEKEESENGQNSGQTILDFEVFDPDDNYNNVVYGPPADK